MKYTAQITVQLDGISIEEFADKVKAAGAIGPVSNAYVHVPIPSVCYPVSTPEQSEENTKETIAGKPRRQRSVKSSDAQQPDSQQAQSTATPDASTQNAAAGTEPSATQSTATSDAAAESPSDNPISEPAATMPEITELRAAASEKIAADPANRPKVHAVIAEFSTDKTEPAMSKIPDQFRAAALAKLKGL